MNNNKKSNPALAIALAMTIVSGGVAGSLSSQENLSPQQKTLFDISARICQFGAQTTLKLLGDDKPKK
jgi:hypothetical protein